MTTYLKVTDESELLGEVIRARREELGLTLADLGQTLGYGLESIRRWEKPSIAGLRRLARALGTTAGTLLDESERE